MGSFLYYFPERLEAPSLNRFSESDVKSGLASVLRDASIAHTGNAKGPDDGTGCMVMIEKPEWPGTNCLYVPEKQEWLKTEYDHWIGWYKDAKPGAADLQRTRIVDGEWIEIAGQQWMIPVCGPQIHKLPLAFKRAVAGEWKSEIKKEFRYLQELCAKTINDLENADVNDAEGIFQRHMDFCSAMLAVNYHMGPWEITALEYLTSESMKPIIRTAIGAVTLERDEAKLQAATATNG